MQEFARRSQNESIKMNKTAVIIISICLTILFGVPLFFQVDMVEPGFDAKKVIIISPHNEQIRHEFGHGFSVWHKNKFNEEVKVVWSVPGGTSEIRRMLQSQYAHAIESGEEPGGEADLVFGGGSYEHGVLKKKIIKNFDGEEVSTTITIPAPIEPQLLQQVYGENVIGDITLYDPDGYWHGLALSGFGIVYNNEVLAELGVESPQGWEALCNPQMFGKLALVNPAQSGSVTTAFEAILKNLGWKKGWQVLRRAAANARYFSASSLKPPADVSQGDAAMGICIDFYGRYQSQAVKSSGGGERVGYIDPPSATMIDPDPISLLRGAPNKAIALRFIRYCMTPEAQALWQFSAEEEHQDGLGPDTFDLRRMPVRREMYSKYMDRMVDKVNPYETAKPAPYPDRNMRTFIAPLFSAMAMDYHHELVEAWGAIIRHPSYPKTISLITSTDVSDPVLKEMLLEFDKMPKFETDLHNEISMNTTENRKVLKYGWLRDGWKDEGLWSPEDHGIQEFRRVAARFFQNQYQTVLYTKE